MCHVVVLQGCYDAGVVYLKANAAVLIALALTIAVILVCIMVLFHRYGCISLVFGWPYIRMSSVTFYKCPAVSL